jgi:hypothetical protein
METPTVETQIAGFIASYTPEMASAIHACRSRMRSHFPRGFELVFENYNALVFGFAPSPRTADALISIAAYPRWVTLFFLNGTTLHDPTALLEGSGRQVRRITLNTPDDLDSAPVRALVAQAIKTVEPALAAAPALTTIVKSISAKQRPRRPAEKNGARR